MRVLVATKPVDFPAAPTVSPPWCASSSSTIRSRGRSSSSGLKILASPMHVIGEETSQRLDVIPAQFRVIVICSPSFAS
jgi:transposase IS66-like protein